MKAVHLVPYFTNFLRRKNQNDGGFLEDSLTILNNFLNELNQDSASAIHDIADAFLLCLQNGEITKEHDIWAAKALSTEICEHIEAIQNKWGEESFNRESLNTFVRLAEEIKEQYGEDDVCLSELCERVVRLCSSQAVAE